jgi:hypothetical protein
MKAYGLIFPFVWCVLVCVCLCVRARARMCVITFELAEFHTTFHIFGHSETHSTNNANMAATNMCGKEATSAPPTVCS